MAHVERVAAEPLPSSGRTLRQQFAAPVLLLAAAAAAGGWGLVLHGAGLSAASPLAFLAIGLASALASIGGFAFGPICGAMLLPFAESPPQAVQVILICSIFNQAMGVWALRRAIAWRALWPYLAGGVLGVPAGTELLLHADAGTYSQLLGAVIIAYAAWTMLGRAAALPEAGRLADAAVGLVGGVMGGLAGFPSGAVTIWCGLKGWDKSRQRGLYQPFILPIQAVALLAMAGLSPERAAATTLGPGALLFVPASMLGTACGLALFRRMTDRQFARTVNLLLLVAGVAMVLR